VVFVDRITDVLDRVTVLEAKVPPLMEAAEDMEGAVCPKSITEGLSDC
jgi:hypothetical protein